MTSALGQNAEQSDSSDFSAPALSGSVQPKVNPLIPVPSENRADYSHQEMEKLTRSDGDLFAVFTDDAGNTRVQYAKFVDYARVAQRQVARRRDGPVDRSTLFYLVGSMMISRLHNYDLNGFVHLLDHNLREIFNLRDLVDWISINKELFVQPMTQVTYAESDREALYAQLDAMDEQS